MEKSGATAEEKLQVAPQFVLGERIPEENLANRSMEGGVAYHLPSDLR